jgi:hypothetical protein
MTRPKLTLVTNDMPPPTEDEPEAILTSASWNRARRCASSARMGTGRTNYVDIVGVARSIRAAPTILHKGFSVFGSLCFRFSEPRARPISLQAAPATKGYRLARAWIIECLATISVQRHLTPPADAATEEAPLALGHTTLLPITGHH